MSLDTTILFIMVILAFIAIVKLLEYYFKKPDIENNISQINKYIEENYSVYLNGIKLTEFIVINTTDNYTIGMVDYIDKKVYIAKEN